MAYSERAKQLRRCRATRADGQRCRAYAVWDDSGLCVAQHPTRRKRGPHGWPEPPGEYLP